MSSGHYSTTSDVTAVRNSGGGGMSITWQCMGCHQKRSTTGTKGTGLRKLCAVCVAARFPVAKVCNESAGPVGAKGNA
jgi:hypothetical protein